MVKSFVVPVDLAEFFFTKSKMRNKHATSEVLRDKVNQRKTLNSKFIFGY